MTQPTWGPWINHTPGPCPVPVGTLAQAEFLTNLGNRDIETMRVTGHPCWRAEYPGQWFGGECCSQILRYRIRQYPETQAGKDLIEQVTTSPAGVFA